MNDLNNLINQLGQYKKKGNELNFEKCPFCSNNNSKSKYKFFLNTELETYICFRGSCNSKGHVSELYKHVGLEYIKEANKGVKMDNKTKRFKAVNENIKDMIFESIKEADKGFKYLELRKIKAETIKYFGIKKDKKGNIVFPFYEKSKICCIKYRIPKKTKKSEIKTWQEKGGKGVLFNNQNIDWTKPVYITEGEIDSMCVYQVGIKNVVSIPFGVNNWDWINIHWDDLKKCHKLIICGDNDEAGKQFVEECIQKLGINKIEIIENNYNDLNELMFMEGEQSLYNCLKNSKQVDIDGLIKVSEIDKYKIDTKDRIDTGMKSLNKIIGGFLPGQFTILSGKRGNGKSTLASQLIIEAISENVSCCVYSGELTKELFKHWLFLQISGNFIETEYDEFRQKRVEIIPDENWNILNKWIDEKLFIYDNTVLERQELEKASILEIFKYANQRHNCKLFLVDNLMTARNQYSGNDFYRSQGEFIGQFKTFANDFNVAVVFVAHPKKTENNNNFQNDDVAGSSENTDRADVVMVIERLNKDDALEFECDSLIHINKNRLYGDLGAIRLKFIPDCKRFLENGVPFKNYIEFDNKKENITKNVDIKIDLPWED